MHGQCLNGYGLWHPCPTPPPGSGSPRCVPGFIRLSVGIDPACQHGSKSSNPGVPKSTPQTGQIDSSTEPCCRGAHRVAFFLPLGSTNLVRLQPASTAPLSTSGKESHLVTSALTCKIRLVRPVQSWGVCFILYSLHREVSGTRSHVHFRRQRGDASRDSSSNTRRGQRRHCLTPPKPPSVLRNSTNRTPYLRFSSSLRVHQQIGFMRLVASSYSSRSSLDTGHQARVRSREPVYVASALTSANQ